MSDTPPTKDPQATVVERAPGGPAGVTGAAHSHARATVPDKLEPNDMEALLSQMRAKASERLVVERTIAQGGMGSIELATDRVLVRKVAKKVLHSHLRDSEGLVRMFMIEARVNGVLDHPHIVPVYDVGEDAKGQLYFTMKLVEGNALKDLIRALPEQEEGRALDSQSLFNMLDIVIKVCDALAFAHSRGVLHCDVKPANVMVGDYGEVYLMDWGIARLTKTTRGTSPPPRMDGTSLVPDADDTGLAVIGTASYMSPEQALGNRASLDARADVFLVGALLYEIVARRPPYQTPAYEETLKLATEANFPRLSSIAKGPVPHELERIIMRAMSKERTDRHANLREVKDDLVRFMRGGAEFPKTTFPKSSYIVREGDKGDSAYIIVSGKCDVLKIIDGTASVMQRLGPGDVFGEMAILTEGARTATILAVDDVTVLVVTREVFESELSAMKPWMRSVTTTLAARIRDLYTQKRVTHVGAPNPTRVARQIYMHLASFGEPREGGGLVTKWTRVAKEIETQLGVAIAMGILGVTARFPQIQVDFAADTIMITDPAALKIAIATG